MVSVINGSTDAAVMHFVAVVVADGCMSFKKFAKSNSFPKI